MPLKRWQGPSERLILSLNNNKFRPKSDEEDIAMFFKTKNQVAHCSTKRTARPDARVSTRIVLESRWVHRNQLERGMYVTELDKPWEETSFMFQGFNIDSHETLRAVQESCEYAFVQTEKLANISSNSAYRLVGATRG